MPMFELVQQESLLLGNAAAVQSLAHKMSARLLVLSDSHGNAEVVRTIVQHFGADCDALCFCGDGARELFNTLALTKGQKSFSSCVPPVVALAQGNGDNPSYQIRDGEFVSSYGVPQRQLFVAAGKVVFLTHGHLYDVYYGTTELFHAAKRERATVALFGHTHIPYAAKEDGLLVLNPGSCSRPRRSSPNSFAVVTITEHDTAYQFYAVREDGAFSAYEPPHEEISLLWQ